MGFRKRVELSLEAEGMRGLKKTFKSPKEINANRTATGGKTALGTFTQRYSPLRAVAPKIPATLY